MLVRALRDEIERNIDTAAATKRMIEQERDMLQGDLQVRMVLEPFHTDVWDSLINAGRLGDYADLSTDVAAAYRQADELNRLIEQFDRHGNTVVYAPLVTGTAERYGHKDVIDIIRERSEETELAFRDARETVTDVIARTCPDCGTTFGSRQAMKSHRTQKGDAAHRDVAHDV